MGGQCRRQSALDLLQNGVLVHGPTSWALAVRTPDGELKVAVMLSAETAEVDRSVQDRIQAVADFMAKDAEARLRIAAFHFEHDRRLFHLLEVVEHITQLGRPLEIELLRGEIHEVEVGAVFAVPGLRRLADEQAHLPVSGMIAERDRLAVGAARREDDLPSVGTAPSCRLD